MLLALLLPFTACAFAISIFILRNPMYALLSLLGVFFNTVLFYLAAGIEFVGFVFLIVYVGAVAVLFLFVIMLLNVKALTPLQKLIRSILQFVAIFAFVVVFFYLQIHVMAALSITLLLAHAAFGGFDPKGIDAVVYYVRFTTTDINVLSSLYTTHSVLFLVITTVLVSALVGAIVLATATTERPTAVSDITLYSKQVGAVAALWPLIIFLCWGEDSVFETTVTEFILGCGVIVLSVLYRRNRFDNHELINAKPKDYPNMLMRRRRF